MHPFTLCFPSRNQHFIWFICAVTGLESNLRTLRLTRKSQLKRKTFLCRRVSTGSRCLAVLQVNTWPDYLLLQPRTLQLMNITQQHRQILRCRRLWSSLEQRRKVATVRWSKLSLWRWKHTWTRMEIWETTVVPKRGKAKWWQWVVSSIIILDYYYKVLDIAEATNMRIL